MKDKKGSFEFGLIIGIFIILFLILFALLIITNNKMKDACEDFGGKFTNTQNCIKDDVLYKIEGVGFYFIPDYKVVKFCWFFEWRVVASLFKPYYFFKWSL